MEIKIIKESKYNQDDFYYIMQDKKYICGSSDLDKINKMYDEIINDPSIIETKVETIKTTQI
jgi:hypothetical protein